MSAPVSQLAPAEVEEVVARKAAQRARGAGALLVVASRPVAFEPVWAGREQAEVVVAEAARASRYRTGKPRSIARAHGRTRSTVRSLATIPPDGARA